jgi:hypothetical protein
MKSVFRFRLTTLTAAALAALTACTDATELGASEAEARRTVDRDHDGVVDWRDNCPDVPNGPRAPRGPGHGGGPPHASQRDSDHDGVGDACEPPACEGTADSDGDGTTDCADGCRFDPFKTAAGVCGCGLDDIDGDVDGMIDCLDVCPGDRDNTCAVECVAQALPPGPVRVGVATAITIDLLGDEVLAVAPDGSLEVIPAGGSAPVAMKLDVFFPIPPPEPAFTFVAGEPGTVLLLVTPSEPGGYLAILELSSETFATGCVGSPVPFEAVAE